MDVGILAVCAAAYVAAGAIIADVGQRWLVSHNEDPMTLPMILFVALFWPVVIYYAMFKQGK